MATEKPILSAANERLKDALMGFHDEAFLDAVMEIRHHGASPLRLEDGTVPLIQALYRLDTDMARGIIGEILKISPTQEALAANLLDCNESDMKDGRTPLHMAASNDAPGMLQLIWPYYKKAGRDINESRYYGGNAPAHAAAINHDNLQYLVSEGADINVHNDQLETPLMLMFDRAGSQSYGNIEKLLVLYGNLNADANAKNDKEQGIIFYALKMHGDEIKPTQVNCLAWALNAGENPFAKDKDGKNAIDYLEEAQARQEKRLEDEKNRSNSGSREVRTRIQLRSVDNVLQVLAQYGYDITPYTEKYGKVSIPHGPVAISTVQYIKEVRETLKKPDIADKLWKPDGTPSKLLLSACGCHVANELFANPYFSENPQAGMALYRRMEETLPPQCLDVLHSTVDLAPFLRAEQPSPASAVEKLLKRKSSAQTSARGEPSALG